MSDLVPQPGETPTQFVVRVDVGRLKEFAFGDGEQSFPAWKESVETRISADERKELSRRLLYGAIGSALGAALILIPTAIGLWMALAPKK